MKHLTRIVVASVVFVTAIVFQINHSEIKACEKYSAHSSKFLELYEYRYQNMDLIDFIAKSNQVNKDLVILNIYTTAEKKKGVTNEEIIQNVKDYCAESGSDRFLKDLFVKLNNQMVL